MTAECGNDALSTQIRKLCCVCLVRAYGAGDNLPIFSRVASLQGYLASKEVVNRTAPELGRIGALECLAALCLTNGNQLASSIPEIITGATRLLGRRDSVHARCSTAVTCMASVSNVGSARR